MDETLISSIEPTAVSNRFTSSFALVEFSGSVSGCPITEPINESLLVIEGSSFVPIATRPPGFTSSTRPALVPSEAISVVIDSYLPLFSFASQGLISISSPTFSEP